MDNIRQRTKRLNMGSRIEMRGSPFDRRLVHATVSSCTSPDRRAPTDLKKRGGARAASSSRQTGQPSMTVPYPPPLPNLASPSAYLPVRRAREACSGVDSSRQEQSQERHTASRRRWIRWSPPSSLAIFKARSAEQARKRRVEGPCPPLSDAMLLRPRLRRRGTYVFSPPRCQP